MARKKKKRENVEEWDAQKIKRLIKEAGGKEFGREKNFKFLNCLFFQGLGFDWDWNVGKGVKFDLEWKKKKMGLTRKKRRKGGKKISFGLRK